MIEEYTYLTQIIVKTVRTERGRVWNSVQYKLKVRNCPQNRTEIRIEKNKIKH